MYYKYSEKLDKHNELRRRLGFDVESDDIIGGAIYSDIGYIIKEPKKVETYAKVLECEDYRNIWLLPNVKKGSTLPTETVHEYEMADGRIYTNNADYVLVYSKDLTQKENALLVSDFLNIGLYRGLPMDFLGYHLSELDDCIGSY